MNRVWAYTLLERARSLCLDAHQPAALQRRRIRSAEPEDGAFPRRRYADWRFFIIALLRLRRSAQIADFTQE